MNKLKDWYHYFIIIENPSGNIGNINTAALGVVFKFKVTRYLAWPSSWIFGLLPNVQTIKVVIWSTIIYYIEIHTCEKPFAFPDCDKTFTLVKSRSSVMIVTRRLNDEQDSHCMVRENRLPVLTARMQDCEEMTNCIFNAFLLCVSIETRQFF